MQFFVGIDVSLDSSSICVIDERGVIIKEGKSDSDPAAIARFIRQRGGKSSISGLRPVHSPNGSTPASAARASG
jgi:transposase